MPPPAVPTPEEILGANPVAGASLRVRGTVVAVTYGLRGTDGGETIPTEARFVLLRNVRQGQPRAAWGLGLSLTRAERMAHAWSLPRPGEVVEAVGVYAEEDWVAGQRPVLREVSELTLVTPAASPRPRAAKGSACTLDLDCDDDWICAAGRCAEPPQDHTWGSAFRDVYGTCTVDADCPGGQHCEAGYTVPDAGAYAPDYFYGRTVGKHLCDVTVGATAAQSCPVAVTADDLQSGRFPSGKELCVLGTILLTVPAADGDTHVQLKVAQPLLYPPDPAIVEAFGAVTENTPPAKDPARPGGGVIDPVKDDRVMTLGTYRFDNGHGWFEVHAVKRYWRAP